MSNSKQVVLDTKFGNITENKSSDKVSLIGSYPFKDSSYAENIKILLESDASQPISVDFPYDGYNMQLFIADFTGDGKSEIMVRGGFGGSGGFEIGVIYKFENNKLVKIFDQNTFNENTNCTAKFKDNYKVQVNCGKKKYSINISSKPKDYLDYIYTSDGKVKSNQSIYVDAPIGIYPIKQTFNDYYDLLIQQRIVGISNADTLGIIQTLSTLKDTNLKTLYQGLLLLSQNVDRKKFSKNLSSYSYNKGYDIDFNSLQRNEIYYGREFNIERDNLDLIVNSINEDRKTLYIDAYLLNLKNYPISEITNFTIGLRDANGRLFAEKTFNFVDINSSLRPYEGKRVLFTFFENEYSLFDVDTSNITWDYTYNIK